MASGGQTEPQLLEDIQELSSDIQTLLTQKYSPVIAKERKTRRRREVSDPCQVTEPDQPEWNLQEQKQRGCQDIRVQ